MVKIFIAIFLMGIVHQSFTQQHWTFEMDFPVDGQVLSTYRGLTGVAVDPDGKVWLAPYRTNDDSLYIPDSSGYVTVNAIYCFNPDGTPATFSDPGIEYDPMTGKIFGVTVNNHFRPFIDDKYGMKRDQNGNILLSDFDEIYRINYQTGAGMNYFNIPQEIPQWNGPTASFAVAGNGDIYIAGLLHGNPLLILNPDFTLKEFALDVVPHNGRAIEVSLDGNTIYLPRYTDNQVYIYSREDSSSSFSLQDTVLQGMRCEASVRDDDGNVWFSGGSYQYIPPDSQFTPGTYYKYDVNSWTLLDSISWQFNQFINDQERDRGIDFWKNGNKIYAYLVCFGASDYNPCQRFIKDNLFDSTITLYFPNGGEELTPGATENIMWTSAGITDLKIEYSTDNGTNWLMISSSYPASSGSYSWTVPNTPSTECKIRLSDVNNTALIDESDSVFTINQHFITVTEPNGGEYWAVGTQKNITWTTSSSIAYVRIAYTYNDGIYWEMITDSAAASDGMYSWTVPNSQSNLCKILIMSASGPYIDDMSDSLFSIVEPRLSVDEPNGGEVYTIGDTIVVRWSSHYIENIMLKYSTDNGLSWLDISAFYPDSFKYYNWQIPSTPSSECLIKLADAADTSVSDVSDAVFTIQPPSSIEIFENGEIPTEYSLYQNFPNPFNPSTKIYYDLPESGSVKLVIYNIQGEEIERMESTFKPAGRYYIEFDASDLPSGIYFYRLQAGDYTETKKMLLLK